MHYSGTDKAKDALIKRYDVKSQPSPTFRFYDEFFKVTGLPSASEYIYGQVTAVRIWGGVLYIFLGSADAAFAAMLLPKNPVLCFLYSISVRLLARVNIASKASTRSRLS